MHCGENNLWHLRVIVMRCFRICLLVVYSLSLALPAAALTFKKGQVAGVSGTTLYVVIDGSVTFVPLSDVRGKTKEGMKEVIAAHVLAGAEIGGLAELEGSGF